MLIKPLEIGNLYTYSNAYKGCPDVDQTISWGRHDCLGGSVKVPVNAVLLFLGIEKHYNVDHYMFLWNDYKLPLYANGTQYLFEYEPLDGL